MFSSQNLQPHLLSQHHQLSLKKVTLRMMKVMRAVVMMMLKKMQMMKV